MPDSSFFDLPPLQSPDEAKPGTRDYAILEWAESKKRDARRFMESQVGYDKIDKAISAIFAYEQASTSSYSPAPKPLSQTRANLVAKTAEDLTAMLTDTRVFWNYSTYNPKYEAQARISNKMSTRWYDARLIDLRVADVVRYYTVAGTGVAHLYFSRRLNDMMVEAEDPRNVLPIDPVSYHTYQDAGGVIIVKQRTPRWVEQEYGKTVIADKDGSGIFGWFTKAIGNVTKKVSGPLSRDNGKEDSGVPGVATVIVNTMYLDDQRKNETNHDVYMGEWKDGNPVTPWSYKVSKGMPLYPFKRMIVWGGGVLLHDGPSPYWHGKYPVIKLTLNPWPMSFLGKAPLWDLLPLNESLNALLRVVDDHAAQVAQPGVLIDKSNTARSEGDKFNSRMPGWKIRYNPNAGKPPTIVQPNALDGAIMTQITWIQDMMRQLSGTADMSQVAGLNQIPSNDTIDTIMKAMTPGNRSRSRILEGFMKEFAEQFLYNMSEFYTLPLRLNALGPQGVNHEDFDYDPGTFIPDDVPDGEPGDIGGTLDSFQSSEPRPRYIRAKQLIDGMGYTFKPGSLLNSAGQQDRMEDLLLSKMGYLSAFTLMENLGKTNFAPADLVVPNDEIGRLQLQAQMGIGMIANAQGRKATDSAPPTMGGGATSPTIQTS